MNFNSDCVLQFSPIWNVSSYKRIYTCLFLFMVLFCYSFGSRSEWPCALCEELLLFSRTLCLTNASYLGIFKHVWFATLSAHWNLAALTCFFVCTVGFKITIFGLQRQNFISMWKHRHLIHKTFLIFDIVLWKGNKSCFSWFSRTIPLYRLIVSNCCSWFHFSFKSLTGSCFN